MRKEKISTSLIVRAVLESQLSIPLPLYESAISAGFPSPADDYIEARLSLDELVVRNPSATFFVKVEGNSMTGAGIYPGDILVVDRSCEAHPGQVIVAIIDGEFTVKRLARSGSQYSLQAANPQYPPIFLTEDIDFQVWGTVIKVIHDPYEL